MLARASRWPLSDAAVFRNAALRRDTLLLPETAASEIS
jgi:hypothetical protein